MEVVGRCGVDCDPISMIFSLGLVVFSFVVLLGGGRWIVVASFVSRLNVLLYVCYFWFCCFFWVLGFWCFYLAGLGLFWRSPLVLSLLVFACILE